MGETNKLPFKPVFNGSVSVEARPERLTAESGAVLLREIDRLADVNYSFAPTTIAFPHV